jgi:TPR repeat protein
MMIVLTFLRVGLLGFILALSGCASTPDHVSTVTPEQRAQIERSAAGGDVEAQYQAAPIHDNGDGVRHDIDKPIYWYQRAAEGGYREAQLELGKIYLKGRGIPKDNNEAEKCFGRKVALGTKRPLH